MNKKQARVAWWGVVLLSLVAIVAGVTLINSATEYASRGSATQLIVGIFVAPGIPVVLIFGLAFIRAGQKQGQAKPGS